MPCGDLLALLDAAKAEAKLRTENVLRTDLRQMFQFALARDIVQRNPLDTVTRREVGGTPVALSAHPGSLVTTRAILAPRRSVGLQRNDVDVTA